jgi:SAM-dependent methyltransferase
MNKPSVYDQFSQDYDRFVDWKARLAVEIPFLTAELATLMPKDRDQVAVLDAACGTGKHIIALSKAGFDGAGADESANMIEIAQENAHAEDLALPLRQTGFGELAQTFGFKTFDGSICLGNSLPHILSEDKLERTLADFRDVLRPGGKLILQNRNFNLVLKEHTRWMDPQTHREGQHTWIFIRFYDFDVDGRITFNIVILSDYETGEFQQRIISTRLWPMQKDELVSALEKAGFYDLHLYGDLQGTPYEPEKSGNLVITARI